jgi:hypothetical protein
MANYLNNSPYFDTPISNNNLSILSYRTIPHEDDDQYYTIAKEFEFRPDLLAFDLYGDAGLWWVFTNRNPDVIKDPIFDFLAGKTIQVSKKSTVDKALGI